MDPLLPADTEEDKDARRKIQFSVPSSVPTQLDPRQVEMIRRRRPTPATLFRLTEPPSPEEDIGPHQWVLGENGALKANLVHTSTYQPPSLKGAETAVSLFWIILDYRIGTQLQHGVTHTWIHPESHKYKHTKTSLFDPYDQCLHCFTESVFV
ncbi:protein phosphatase 1 regulatory subunit 1B-like isoform X2 [Sander lucioperca]|uniref:protein phosphatase 1 regulatory subunit 1B-like isoform X2 n=1 Tax=Sander lucioperca TaxID=283035 RepID=UPI001653A9E0|nr:protein phosphatase 1 regulatory subunit 1B-like isoform X2 [Sander lucioperca]